MTPVERVERLVRSGTVDEEEGRRLLAALHAEPAPSMVRLLLNPFERVGGGLAAAIGLGVSLASIVVARSGVRFDGVLDLHIPHHGVATYVAFADQIVSWPLAAIVFYAYARLFSRHLRLLDFVGMTGFARLPLLIAAVPLREIIPRFDLHDPMHPPPGFILVSLASLVFVVLNVALLYQGFKNASGLAGAKLFGGFIAVLIGAEIVSKLALALLT